MVMCFFKPVTQQAAMQTELSIILYYSKKYYVHIMYINKKEVQSAYISINHKTGHETNPRSDVARWGVA